MQAPAYFKNKVTGDEASLIKVYIRIFKASKREMMLKHNLSVEIH